MSTLRTTRDRRFARLTGVLAGALTLLVTTGASLSSPEDHAVRSLPDPVGVVGALASNVGLQPGPVRPAAGGQALKGLFKLDPASCASGPASGSYFRMIQPGGGANGPFIENNTSACGDKTYTDLAGGGPVFELIGFHRRRQARHQQQVGRSHAALFHRL